MTERTDRIYKIEAQIARETDSPSCTPGLFAREILGIANEVKGLSVVDLAAGTCSMVADLLDQGADAHAVDLVYDKSTKELDDSSRNVLYSQVEMAPLQYRDQMKTYGLEALEKFLASYQANRQNYHRAYLTRLPFSDNFSDITTSLNGITNLSEDPELILEMLREAIRITKPGGKVIVAPVHSMHNEYHNLYARTHAQVIEELEVEGYTVETQRGESASAQIPLGLFTRLVITKPQSI